jgi:hypothetical protein
LPPATPPGALPSAGNITAELPRNWKKILIRSGAGALVLLLIGAGVLLFNVLSNRSSQPALNSSIANTNIPLSEFANSGSLSLLGAQSLAVNGQLRANESFILAPQAQPAATKSERGQLYYDSNTNQLAYYNGTQYVQLPGNGSVVQTFQGQSGNVTLVGGNGITVTGTTLANSGVTSVGGQTGDIGLGNGLAITSGNLQNTGIVSAVSGSPANLSVTNDGNGNITITNTGLGTGTVQSPGGTAGHVALFTAAQTIEDSIITQSGTTVTVGGDLSVTGNVNFTNALTVANGGTGAQTLTANGVIVGNGTSALTSVAAAGSGLCLMSTAGAPAFSACPGGGGGVDSLNGLTGALTLANATALGSTITINDATITGTKGIASFNATNFSASGGAVNTVQNINTGATPTFAGVNTNNITPSAALTVGISAQTALLQGSTTTITSSGAGASLILNSGGSIELQDNTNITGNGTLTGDLAVNGGDITSTGALNITPTGTLAAGSATQTLTLQGNASTTLRATNGANTTTVAFTSPVAGTTLNFPALAAGTYTICTSNGNCAGAGVTLQAAYDNSSTPEIVLDATRAALTIRDNAVAIGGNLLEVQNNNGATTYLGVTATGTTITGTATVSGNINSSGGALQTANTSRIDNTGNLVNIAAITASGNATLQGGTATLGTNAQLGSLVINDGSSNTGTIRVAALGQDTVYTIPDPGVGTATFCLTTGNCSGVGGGVTTSGGTTNRLSKFSGAQAITDSTITDNGTTVTTSVNMVIQGGTATLGTAAQAGSLLLNDGNGQTTTLQAGDSVGNLTFVLPTSTGSATQCLKQSGTGNQLIWDACEGGLGGISTTLQQAYGNGNSITTTDARDVNITLANTTTDSNFAISVADGSTGYFSLSRANGGGTSDPAQLLLVDNQDTDRPVAVGVKIQAAAGGLTTAIDASDAEIGDALNVGANNIVGTTGNLTFSNFSVTGASGNIVAGTYNSQTISSAANFTGSITVATDLTLTAGDIAVNGGDITASGALNITPGGTLTVGATGQALTLQGNASTKITATGGGFTTTVGFTGTPIGTVNYNFDRSVAAGTYNVCSTAGNCSGVGGGVTTSGGTTGTLAMFTGSQAIGDSLLSQATGTVTLNGNLNISSGVLQTGGTTRIDNSGNATNIGALTLSGAISGGTSFTGSGTINTTGGVIQTASVTRIDNGGNLTNIGSLTASGNGTLQGGSLTLGAAAQAGSVVISDGSSNIGTLKVAALGQDTIYTLPDAGAGTATICLTTGNCAGTGTGVTSAGGSLNRLAKFSGAQAIADSTITDNGTTVSTSVNMVIQGGSATLGTTSQIGSLLLHDGNGQTTTLQAGDSSGSLTFILPTTAGSATQCLKQSGTGNQLIWDACEGGGGGVSTTLQQAYINGNTITTADARNVSITLANTTTDSNFAISIADDSTGYFSLSRADGTGTNDPAQLFLVDNLDTNRPVAVGVKIQAAVGGITTAIDASDAEIGDALNVGANNIVGTTGNLTFSNFSVTGSTGNIVAGTYNSQTISSAANFTGTVTVATDLTLTAGDLAVNGGDINSSGSLNINPGGTFTAGSTGQTTTLRGSTTSITSNGAGNDITLTSADQIILNAGSTIELQDSTNVTGDLDASGALAVGTANALTIDASGNIVTTGDLAVNGGDITTSGALNITPGGTLTAGDTAQALTLQGNASTKITATASGFKTTVGFTGTPTGAVNYTFDQAATPGTYAICTAIGNCLGGSGGANTALSNLSGVAINTTLLPGAAGTVNLGSSTLPFGELSLAGTSGTPGTNNFKITGAATGGTKTITIPNATGTLCLDTNNCSYAPATGSTSYIQNQSASPQTADFQITGNGRAATFNGTTGINTGATAGTQRIDASGNLVNIGTVTTSGAINSQTISSTANFTGTVTIQGSSALTLGVTGTSTGAALFKGATAASGTLTLIGQANPTNNTITLPNETGTICLQNSVNCGFATGSITLQNAYNNGNSITTTNGRDISFAMADTATDPNFLIDLQCDTTCSTNGRFAVQDDGVDVFNVAPAGGAVDFINSVNSTQAFNIETSGGGNLFTVDTINSQIGVNLGVNNVPSMATAGLQVQGALRISGTGGSSLLDTYVTPGGASIGARISVVNDTLAGFNQILAMGITAASDSTTRAITLADGRTTAHQPTLAVLSPDENNIGGLSWDGSNTGFLFKNTNASGTVGLNINGTTTLQATTTGANVTGNLAVSGLSSGDALTISNSTSTGNIAVFNDNATAVATIANGGATTFQNQTDSTAGFQILSSASLSNIPQFVVDTTNSRTYIGNPTGDTTGALLVLDTKTGSGDPTGVNGAIYYSTGGQGGASSAATTNAGKFRCFEGGVWLNCTGMRDIVERRWGYVVAANTTGALLGYSGNIVTGQITSGSGGAAPQTEGNYLSYATAASTNSTNGWGTSGFSATVTEGRWTPKLSTRIRVDASAVTNARYWAALTSAAMTATNPTTTTAAETTEFIGLIASSSVASGAWICGSGDGATQSGISTGVTMTANHYYDVIVDMSVSGVLVCSISDNGGAFTTVRKTTNLPNSATDLGISINLTTLANAVRTMFIQYAYVESN